jgi:hypothetical protein
MEGEQIFAVDCGFVGEDSLALRLFVQAASLEEAEERVGRFIGDAREAFADREVWASASEQTTVQAAPTP